MRAWEPEPGELRSSSKPWNAFKLYRDLGSERTHKAVAKILYGDREKHGLRTVEKWSSEFDWIERVKAMEARDQMIVNEAIERHKKNEATAEAAKLAAHQALNFKNEEKAATLEAKFLDRVEKLIDELPLIQKTGIREENGVTVAYVVQPATKNAVLDAARLHKIATRNEPERVDITSDGEQIQIIEYTVGNSLVQSDDEPAKE